MNRAIEWSVHNPVAVNLMMFVLVVGGIMAMYGLRQEQFPATDPGAVSVSVEYRGASPEEVEKSVCIRIEEAIEGTPELDEISTVAAEGRCDVTAELTIGADTDVALAEIKNRIDSIDTFPVETEKPSVSKVEFQQGVLKVAISGELDEGDLKELGQRARDEVALLPEVSQVEVLYDRPYEVSIEVSEESLRRHGLDLGTVADAVRNASLDLPGGSVKTRGGEILLRAKSQAYRGMEFERIVILTKADGTLVRLGELGHVVDGFEDTELKGRFNGDPSVVLAVSRIGDEDILEAARAVKEWLPGFAASVPQGVDVTIFNDESMDLIGRLNVMEKNGLSGLALVLIVLTIFLRFRLAMWVAAGVPISLLGALMFFPVLSLTISTMTVLAFILVLGILVDDAIVIGESVHSYELELGDQVEAAIRGTQAVYVPVIFGVMTSMAAFLPILLVGSRMASFFSAIGTVAILCLVFSLIESQLILPAHLAHRSVTTYDAPQNRFVRRWTAFQNRMVAVLDRLGNVHFAHWLDRALYWRYAVVVGALGILLIAFTLFLSGHMRYQFFPEIPGNVTYARLTMTQGVPIERTELAVNQIQRAAERLKEQLDAENPGPSIVKHTFASIGERLGREDAGFYESSTGSHIAEIGLELIPGVDRDVSTEEVLLRWRELTGPIPDAVTLQYESDGHSAGAPIHLEVSGTDDFETLTQASEMMVQFFRTFAGVYDVTDSFQGGKPEVQLTIRDTALPLGLTQIDLARQVRQAFYGEEAQRIQRGRDDVRVMVRYPDAERRSLGSLEEMRIRTADGTEVPFAAVADAEISRGFSSIRRTDRRRVVTVTAGVDRTVAVPSDILRSFDEWAPKLKAAFPTVVYKRGGEQEEEAEASAGVFKGFILALMIIFVLLAVPLKSYVQPLIIMSVIPFGTVGAVIGHILLGWDVTFLSVLGMMALAGVVVNASLVLVHRINRHRDDGMPLLDAVRLAARQRFRPIVLTTATTFFGLLPLMRETSQPALPLVPIGISLGFGVLYASIMTLFLVPVGYVIIDDMAQWLRRPTAHGRAEPKSASPTVA